MESTSGVSLETHQDMRRGQAGGDAGFDGVARAVHPRNEIQLQRRGKLSVVRAACALERAMDRSFGGDEVGEFTEHDKDFARLAFGYMFQPFNIRKGPSPEEFDDFLLRLLVRRRSSCVSPRPQRIRLHRVS